MRGGQANANIEKREAPDVVRNDAERSRRDATPPGRDVGEPLEPLAKRLTANPQSSGTPLSASPSDELQEEAA